MSGTTPGEKADVHAKRLPLIKILTLIPAPELLLTDARNNPFRKVRDTLSAPELLLTDARNNPFRKVRDTLCLGATATYGAGTRVSKFGT